MDWWSLAITDPNPIVLIVLEVRASSCGYSAFEFQFCRSRSRYLIFNCLCHWPGKKQEIVLRSLELGVCLMQLFQFWSHDVHPVQNLLLCTKFHENRMIFCWDMSIYQFSKWRPSAILELFYHHTRLTNHEVSVAGRSCLSNFMSIWYTDMKI